MIEPGYDLRSLEELEEFINKEKCLPEVVTDPKKAPQIDVLALNGKLFAKIEVLQAK